MNGWLTRLRVTARIARRQVRRTMRSSVLVVLMVALPVGALGAAAIISDSSIGTTEQRMNIELGQNQSYALVTGIADPTLHQYPTIPDWWRIDYFGNGAADEEYVQIDGPTDPTALLPAGTKLLPVRDNLSVRAETAGGIGSLTAIIGDVWDPAFAGRFDVVAGTPPTRAGEVMATSAALERFGADIGDTITLIEPALTARVTGVIDFAAAPDIREIVFLPWEHISSVDDQPFLVRWYLPELSLGWPEIQALNPQGVTVYSRTVVLDPPAVDWSDFGSRDDYWATMGPMLAVFGAGAAFAAYQVILLAGAAFAVSARRQRQALATAASVGAASAEVRRIVVLQGTVLGLVGGALGLGLGALGAWVFMRLADDGSKTLFWGYNVPWWLLAAVLVFAVVVGTLSALIPARSAAKADVLQALRGARKPQRVSIARPLWGSVLLIIGLALTVTGVLAVLAVAVVDATIIGWDSPLRWMPYILIIAGPLIVQVGIILAGAWILHLFSRGLSRLGLGARLASRDAAANAARSVPAFAAITAAVFIAVFALNLIGASFARSDRNHLALAPHGYTFAELWASAASEGYDSVATRLSEELLGAGAVDVAIVERSDAYNPHEPPDDMLVPMVSYPESALCVPEVKPEECSLNWYDASGSIAVIAPDDLPTVLGGGLSTDVMSDFRSGTALTLNPALIEGGQIEIGFWPRAELWATEDVTGPTPFTQNREATQRWETLPATAIDAPIAHYVVILSPDTAAKLGITTTPQIIVGAFVEPPSQRTIDALNQVGHDAANYYFWVQVERGADQPWPWYLLIGGIAAILVLGASAVSIGLARFDGRIDDATLAAVGGDRGIRRSISFWQAIVITGVGAWAGALTGLLPSWAFAETASDMGVADFPWLVLAGIVILLPLAVAVVAWIISPRPAVLTRRTAIT